MERTLTYNISENDIPNTIQSFLRTEGYSSQIIKELKKEPESILIDGKREYMKHTLEAGETLTVHIQEEGSSEKITAVPMDLDIVYEDPYLFVIDKHPGVLSMSNNTRQLTAQAVLNRYLEKGGGRNTSHIVHRLDRDTSGLMVYAKDVQTQQTLVDGWQELVTDRRYIALVEGELEKAQGCIRSWLTEDKRFVTHSSPVDNGGKYAVTHYNVLTSSNGYSLVECVLETGRKNQIRVHMADLGHPVVGDSKYGSSEDPMRRLGLHAYMLCFTHPVTGKRMRFETPVPACFEKCLNEK